ncbi:MAG: neutral/alkaline non-lysosomal ceramidase N-terminal domain-containing protein [Acidothermaceae bacterium]
MSSGIKVGLSKVEITPPLTVPMAGFAARTLPATGVHDPLYARALVVSDVEPAGVTTVLVVLDVVSIPPGLASEIRHRIETELGVPTSAVMVATIHTHGGPATDERGNESVEIRDYATTLCQRAVSSAVAAAQNLTPARMVLNFGDEPTVGKNRRRPGGVIDPTVQTVRIEDSSGKVVGMLCSYACHPVTLGPDNRLITADYPGAVVRALEATYPDAIALFATGCAGQINTGHRAEDSFSTQPSDVRTFAEMTRLGRAIAGAAIQASEHAAGPRGTPSATAPANNGRPQVNAVTVSVEAPWLPVDEPDAFRAKALAWRGEAASTGTGPGTSTDTAAAERDRLLRSAAWAERTAASAPHPRGVALDVTGMRWGDIVVVGLPGEPFVEFALDIRRRSAPNVVVIGYANGVPGYVPHRSAYPEGGYEVMQAHIGYGAPAAFAPEAGELLVEAALQAIAALERQERNEK